MARPPSFDRHDARDRALLLFWRKGYQAASLSDLLQAMELGRSSFYAAFGDKRALFVECLDLFAERTRDMVGRARGKLPPLDALQFFFTRAFSGANAERAQWGCLLVNTVLEMSGVDEALAELASSHLSSMQCLFRDCLGDAGFSPAEAEKMAALLMLINEGFRVSSRRALSPTEQLAPVDAVFRLLRAAMSAATRSASPP